YAPDRLKGVASLPVQDMDASVKELERTVKDLGFVGGAGLPDPVWQTPLGTYFDPPYAELPGRERALGVPFLGRGKRPLAQGRYGSLFFLHTYGHPFEQMLAMQAIVAGGVLDRFPRLRVAFLEGDCGWLPWWLHRMDSHYEKLGEFVPCREKPSAYLQS